MRKNQETKLKSSSSHLKTESLSQLWPHSLALHQPPPSLPNCPNNKIISFPRSVFFKPNKQIFPTLTPLKSSPSPSDLSPIDSSVPLSSANLFLFPEISPPKQ
ncbi:hypothetical protein Patl1_17428 [Pistacia atlantica]|uniref:Uncharacterized protein n=1 Tax=Pistacia atlantica TaxID=434234 RepID=A0ACC1BZN6_9ROSI|nr:hypothetical protein Patl1_17428 [Pistacia atlantica]